MSHARPSPTGAHSPPAGPLAPTSAPPRAQGPQEEGLATRRKDEHEKEEESKETTERDKPQTRQT